MLKNEDIICISSIDWSFIWQGHQEIMTRFARNGNRVLFIENTGVRTPGIKDFERIMKRIASWKMGVHGIRKIEEGLYVYSPIVLPFPYLKMARLINKRLIFSVLFRWLKTVGFSEPLVWVFLPTGLSLDLIDKIKPKVLIYYCIDSFQYSSNDAKKIKYTEALMLKKADLVFVTSEGLFKYCAQYNRNVHYFPFGVNVENFKNALNSNHAVPDDIKKIRRPIAGYIGGVHKWIDFDLLRYVAMTNREVSFVFCGPVQTDISKVKDLSNVIFLGQKSQEALPLYVMEFDIAIIPYKITEYTKNVYPTKLNEYLSIGKDVVSTDLPEVMKFNRENDEIVSIADTPAAFATTIRRVIEMPLSEKRTRFAMDVAERNSWSSKIKEMSSLIERVAVEKAAQREALWKYNLIKLYKNTKVRLVPTMMMFAFIYLTLFHTPLVWYIAKPLEIRDQPQNSDVIAALGAGVGESGKAGEGYQEKVDRVVKLYNQHFAGRILYLSGYRYLMKEAHVMKILSIAMGVDEEDIIIDDVPVNTYEMVVHLRELAMQNNWRNIILVSSPYHMLRLKLLCKKQLNDANVFCIPVEFSSFYIRGPRLEGRQIRGILQEYLAILYYKMKGYI